MRRGFTTAARWCGRQACPACATCPACNPRHRRQCLTGNLATVPPARCAPQAPGAATASQPLPQPLRSFFEWVGAQQAAERLEFSIKDGDLPEAVAVGEEVAAAGEAAELAVATEGAGAEEC